VLRWLSGAAEPPHGAAAGPGMQQPRGLKIVPVSTTLWDEVWVTLAACHLSDCKLVGISGLWAEIVSA
jgi:hypothetical protein